jgi:tetratricopeptide (TPR) repeat protein
MTRRRTLFLTGVCVAAGVVATAATLRRARNGPRLPEYARVPGLPGAFDAALRAARERAARGPADDVRLLAQLYQANRLYAEARACYGVLAAQGGGLTARDHYFLAAMALDESDLEGAKVELAATLAAEPRYVPALNALADAAFKSGQSDEAARRYAAVLAIEPDNPAASLGLARIELQRRDDAGAEERLQRLLERRPESAAAAAVLSQVLERQGAAERAAALRQWSEQAHDPVAPDPWLRPLLLGCYDVQRLGLAFEQYRLAGQMDEALPLLDRLEELDPSSWIPPLLRGWSENKAGRYGEAVRQYQAALDKGGDPEKIGPLMGAALISGGRLRDAAALLADLHARRPRSEAILRSYCEVAVKEGDHGLARTLLAELLKEDPFLYLPNMSMVQILWSEGHPDEAVPYLQRVARVYPADIDARGLLAQYYLERADPFSAIGPLEQALAVLAGSRDKRRDRISGLLYTAYLVGGSLKAAQGQFAPAVDLAERAIALDPAGMRGYALEVNVLKRTGDFRRAADAMERLVALNPADPAARMSLGDLAYQADDRDRARREWQRALEQSPAGPSKVRAALERRLAGPMDAAVLP